MVFEYCFFKVQQNPLKKIIIVLALINVSPYNKIWDRHYHPHSTDKEATIERTQYDLASSRVTYYDSKSNKFFIIQFRHSMSQICSPKYILFKFKLYNEC